MNFLEIYSFPKILRSYVVKQFLNLLLHSFSGYNNLFKWYFLLKGNYAKMEKSLKYFAKDCTPLHRLCETLFQIMFVIDKNSLGWHANWRSCLRFLMRFIKALLTTWQFVIDNSNHSQFGKNVVALFAASKVVHI